MGIGRSGSARGMGGHVGARHGWVYGMCGMGLCLICGGADYKLNTVLNLQVPIQEIHQSRINIMIHNHVVSYGFVFVVVVPVGLSFVFCFVF